MPGRYLLDTNVVIAIFAGELPATEALGLAEEVFLPSIVLGELLFGALKSSRSADNVSRISDFTQASVVLPCDAATAYEYAVIKSQLQAKGQPIPENDIWVAAIARQFGLVLASRDEHFAHINHLQIENW
ncbi:MAG: type II toxin-antitoxin system VapC family toxin [Planctomycetes bacterium]|nr:type II toxin-antitoxin system VapC family toxin [Planctomycetota bacterium]